MTPFDPFFVFLLFFLSVGDERLCFARNFQGANDIAPFMREASEDADFKMDKIGQNSVRSGLILTKYFVKSSHFR